jgi:hypothetical protein
MNMQLQHCHNITTLRHAISLLLFVESVRAADCWFARLLLPVLRSFIMNLLEYLECSASLLAVFLAIGSLTLQHTLGG